METVELASEERPGLTWRFRVLSSVWGRLRGLLGTSCNAAPVLLTKCASIHTFAMGYALDVAFIGKDGEVLLVRRGVVPGQVVSVAGAFCVAERPASDDPWLACGERVRIMVINVEDGAVRAAAERTQYEF